MNLLYDSDNSVDSVLTILTHTGLFYVVLILLCILIVVLSLNSSKQKPKALTHHEKYAELHRNDMQLDSHIKDNLEEQIDSFKIVTFKKNLGLNLTKKQQDSAILFGHADSIRKVKNVITNINKQDEIIARVDDPKYLLNLRLYRVKEETETEHINNYMKFYNRSGICIAEIKFKFNGIDSKSISSTFIDGFFPFKSQDRYLYFSHKQDALLFGNSEDVIGKFNASDQIAYIQIKSPTIKELQFFDSQSNIDITA